MGEESRSLRLNRTVILSLRCFDMPTFGQMAFMSMFGWKTKKIKGNASWSWWVQLPKERRN